MQLEAEQIEAPGEALEQSAPAERNWDAEASEMGWQPLEEFRGDPAKHIDAKTFVERGEVMLPLVKKQLSDAKAEISNLKKDMKRLGKFVGSAEERGYNRAMAELEKKHDEAVEVGDVGASKAIRREMDTLKQDYTIEAGQEEETPAFDPQQARRELNEWMAENEWYADDKDKRDYADLQAGLMGPATEWPDGNKAWLAELGKRVARKFAAPKPNPVNGGGNRQAASNGSRTFANLPPEDQRIARRFVESGVFKSVDDYVRDYGWDDRR